MVHTGIVVDLGFLALHNSHLFYFPPMKAQVDIGWSTAKKNIWILLRKMNDIAKLLHL